MSPYFQIPQNQARKEWLAQAWITLCDVQPLTDVERHSLFLDLRKANETNGGWDVQTALIAQAFERNLQNRTWWHWGEYEYWRQLYFSGLRPTGFTPKPDPYALTQENNIYDFISLPVAKKILATAGKDAPKKDVTKGVAEMFRSDKRLFLEAKRIICIKIKEQEFRTMVQTIDLRANSLSRAQESSEQRRPLLLQGYDPVLEKAFLDAALKRNPNQVPPFWPNAPNYWMVPWEDCGSLYSDLESNLPKPL